MDFKRVEQLLAKYWSCETSLEEEQELRTYFLGDDVPGQFKEASELFRYFEQQKQSGLEGASFDRQLGNTLRDQEPKRKVIRLSVFNVARIAAGLIVVVAAVYFVRTEIKKSYPAEDTFDDPKVAFEETKKALMMISKGFGKGQQEATKITIFNEAEDQVQGKETKR